MALNLLPRDILWDIADYLKYQDIVSLSMVSSHTRRILDDTYWCERRITGKEVEKPKNLSWKGYYAYLLSRQGYLFPGCENFLSHGYLFLEAYRREEEELLLYFLKVFQKEVYLLPLVENTGAPSGLPLEAEDNSPLQEDIRGLILSTLQDSREELFLKIWELRPTNFPEDTLPYYMIAHRRSLSIAKNAILEATRSHQFISWLTYCVMARDRVMFDDLRRMALGPGIGIIRSLLEVYPWPEVEALIPHPKSGEEGYHITDYRTELVVPKIISYPQRIRRGFDHPFLARILGGERYKAWEYLAFLQESTLEVRHVFTDTITSVIEFTKGLDEFLEDIQRTTIPSFSSGFKYNPIDPKYRLRRNGQEKKKYLQRRDY